MKKKLNILFVLITISLAGIIIFQVYWSLNAYKVNKSKFDTDVNTAMQNAMDDCKKDYFDSIRVVLIKRLSDTSAIKIKIDTLHEADTVHKQLTIHISNKDGVGVPFQTTTPVWAYYKQKINHTNATVPEVLTEMSFYVPSLMNDFNLTLGMHDISSHYNVLKAFLKAHSNVPSDSLIVNNNITPFGIYALPPNYSKSDSLKLNHYLKVELEKMNITANYQFYFSNKHTLPQKLNLHHSETDEYSYKYHGFIFLGVSIRGTGFFTRAVFRNPQYGILKGMLLPLCLSLLLIVFTIYCFNYIIQLVIHQKKLAELKDDFINNMTHELKTPIATITVAIEGLQKFNALNDPEKIQRYLQTSRNELARLNDLVTKVLNIAAFENQKIELNKEKINVDELVDDVISTEKTKAAKTINITYANNDVTMIYADKLHFRNVLVNIIDNAIKYSNDPANIAVNCFKQDNNVIFSIKDNGIGIPHSHIGQIFDKFHRVPTGNVHNVKGTGLGLSYVKYIVEAHGGDITVKSEINTGSEFTVSIPLNNG